MLWGWGFSCRGDSKSPGLGEQVWHCKERREQSGMVGPETREASLLRKWALVQPSLESFKQGTDNIGREFLEDHLGCCARSDYKGTRRETDQLERDLARDGGGLRIGLRWRGDSVLNKQLGLFKKTKKVSKMGYTSELEISKAVNSCIPFPLGQHFPARLTVRWSCD